MRRQGRAAGWGGLAGFCPGAAFVTRRHGELHRWRLLVAVGGRGRLPPADRQKRQNRQHRQRGSSDPDEPAHRRRRSSFERNAVSHRAFLSGWTPGVKPRGIDPASDGSLYSVQGLPSLRMHHIPGRMDRLRGPHGQAPAARAARSPATPRHPGVASSLWSCHAPSIRVLVPSVAHRRGNRRGTVLRAYALRLSPRQRQRSDHWARRGRVHRARGRSGARSAARLPGGAAGGRGVARRQQPGHNALCERCPPGRERASRSGWPRTATRSR